MTLWSTDSIQFKAICIVHLVTGTKIICPSIGPCFINDSITNFTNYGCAESHFIVDQAGIVTEGTF